MFWLGFVCGAFAMGVVSLTEWFLPPFIRMCRSQYQAWRKNNETEDNKREGIFTERFEDAVEDGGGEGRREYEPYHSDDVVRVFPHGTGTGHRDTGASGTAGVGTPDGAASQVEASPAEVGVEQVEPSEEVFIERLRRRAKEMRI